MTPRVFRIWVKKTQGQISTHMVLCFLQWPCMEKTSRGMDFLHVIVHFSPSPSLFMFSPSRFPRDSWTSPTHPPCHTPSHRHLMYPKPRREAIRNYWKTTKMCFKILISQKLPRRALGPEMSLSSLLQRRRCVKPGHPAQGDLSEVTGLGEREP